MSCTHLKKLNIFCYFITALVLVFVICLIATPADVSEEGAQFDNCMETARLISPETKDRWVLQKACIGNYLINSKVQ